GEIKSAGYQIGRISNRQESNRQDSNRQDSNWQGGEADDRPVQVQQRDIQRQPGERPPPADPGPVYPGPPLDRGDEGNGRTSQRQRPPIGAQRGRTAAVDMRHPTGGEDGEAAEQDATR